MTEVPHPAELLFSQKHPLTSLLDLKFEKTADHELTVTTKAPNSFADRDGKHVHSGFSTLLLDTVLGSCAIGELEKLQPIATIKLTCNHIRRPLVGENLICRARFDAERHSVSFIKGEVLSAKDNELIASAIGTFMIGTRAVPLGKKI